MKSGLALTLSLYLSPTESSWELVWIVRWIKDLDLVSTLEVDSEFIRLSFRHYAFIRSYCLQLVFLYFEIVIALIDFVKEGRVVLFCFQDATNFPLTEIIKLGILI